MTLSSSYQIIPRQFRPQTFKKIAGQSAIVTTLKNALKFQRLAHAYLFCGCRGTGKTTLARVFAKALNCAHRQEDGEPCNECSSCMDIQSGRSLDLLEIDGASNRGIDDIRQINETISYTPSAGQFKIYIIDEVHMLTKEAFNALLKTLEEPPPTVKFIFATTEPHKIPSTIISRCQRFDLSRISPEVIQEKLKLIAQELSVDCEDEALALIAHLSEGSLRDAESLLDQVICYTPPPITAEQITAILGLIPKPLFFALDEAICHQRHEFAFELSETLFSSGKDFTHFLDHLLEHFQTLLQVKFKKHPFFLNPTHQAHYYRAAQDYSEEQLLYILDYLLHWQQQLSKSPFKRAGLEMILLHLLRSKQRIPFSSLIKKLSELQQISIKTSEHPEVESNPRSEATPPPSERESTSQVHPDNQLMESNSKREEISLLSEPDTNKPFTPQRRSNPIRKGPQERELGKTDILNLNQTLVASETVLENTQTQCSQNPMLGCQQNPVLNDGYTYSKTKQSHYDTIVRFAAVELEGIVSTTSFSE